MEAKMLALPTFWETAETIGKIRGRQFQELAEYLALDDCDAIIGRLLKVLTTINDTQTAYKILENAVNLLEVHAQETREAEEYTRQMIKNHSRRKEVLEEVALKIQGIYEIIPDTI